ncbi:type I restriction endonuclease subunit R, EcoR124 family, partial [Anaerococcus octavius]|uniref:type I restriction endonuclease subunit R, EcoR124 family n=1 Tax=Anaerococcus octavius TaxID=54007 RepID=UPI002356BB16
YGFTGTPIFAENKKQAIGDLPQTTEEQFGKRLHEYTIKEAIGDGAVLGFQVENKQMITNDQAYEIVEEHFPEKNVYDMDPYDLEKYIPEEYFETDAYKLKVIDDIINNMAWKFALDREPGKSYGAILTTSSIKDAQKYYELFKRVKSLESDIKISDRIRKKQADFPKIAITYSISENQEMTQENKEKMMEALADYNEEFATNFSLETIGAYNRNLNDRLARKKNKYKIRSEQVDIVIVVDRLLTGFDAPNLGLLFIDRPPMTPQGLIQAFSRTNRLYDERKSYGQIVTFRRPFAFQDAIKNAFSLYSNGGGNFVTAPDYNEAKRIFEDAAEDLLQFRIVDNPEAEIGFDAMVDFVKAFQKFDRANAAVMVYSDYTEDEDFYKNIINEELLAEYLDYYNYVKALVKPGDIDYDIDLLDINYHPISVRSDTIDYSYLTSLIQEKANSRGETNYKNADEIEKTLAELIKQNPAKGEVYRQIIEEIDQNPDKYQNAIIDEVAKDKFNTIIQKNINDFVDNYKVNKEDLEFLIANYPIDKKEVKKPLGEDKLIKNANKDLYNEESGENLSLLKFKSMLRKDTHKFIDQKIRPYFE